MKKLFINLAILGFLVALTLAAILTISPHNNSNYLAAAADKHKILTTTASPRIILVGGSNLAFSVDSERMEKQFNMPVINMGLHAGVGLRFMLQEVEPILNEGDTLIIFPEYEFFTVASLDGRPVELGTVIKLCTECITGIRTPLQYLNVIVGVLQKSEGDILRPFKQTGEVGKVNPYARDAFNRRGDHIGHLDQPDAIVRNEHIYIEKLNPDPVVKLLNSYYQSINGSGITILLMFPGIPDTDAEPQAEKYEYLYNTLKADLLIPILGTPQDFFFPESYFYDSPYHMNRIGREVRTDRILDLLIPVLGDNRLSTSP